MVLVEANPYYFAAIGGILLGIATTINYAFRGKVTGMSSMIYGILTLNKDELPQKLGIIGGMLAISGIFFNIFGYGTSNKFTPFGPAEQIAYQTSYLGYGVAGLLVGFGVKLSQGCTSGHGLCGLPRLSIRSFVAVCIFLCTAIAISTLRYYVSLGPFSSENLNPVYPYNHAISSNICIVVGILLPIIGGFLKTNVGGQLTKSSIVIDQLVTFIVGVIFGSGLLVGGMVRRVNILGFLGLGQNWNPSLLFVLGCGLMVNLATFNYMLRVKKVSYMGRELFNPENRKVDWKLMLGACSFGLGWGVSGLCPGPAVMQLSIFTLPISVIFVGSVLVGMTISRKLEEHLSSGQDKEETKKEAGENNENQISDAVVNRENAERVNRNDNSFEIVQLNPIVELVKQESFNTLRVTAETFQSKTASDLDNPNKLK